MSVTSSQTEDQTPVLLESKRDPSQGRIWSHVRSTWLVETPEERVRQEYLCILVNEYGYSLDQIAEELTVTGSGSGKARADYVIRTDGSFEETAAQVREVYDALLREA